MKTKIFLFAAFLCLAGFLQAQIPTIIPVGPVYQTLVLLKGARIRAGQYLNFGPTYGTAGYGIYDNSGTLQYKNSGGSWANLGAGGATTFLALTDTPAAYTAAGGYLVRVNAGANALEFVAGTGSLVGLGSVENTALSTWAGTANITTLGTIGTGVWNATAIADGKIASALTGKSYNGVTPTAAATGFSLAGGTTSKTLTVELDSLVNQDLTTDASPTHAGLTLTGFSGFVSASAGALSADTQLAWSSGILTAQTSSGTNTDTKFTLKGKGSGDGALTLYGGGSSIYHVIQASDTGTAANNTLRIGLDPGSHTLIVCDLPDINDVSLPIYLPNAAPTVRIWDAVINTYTDYSAGYIRTGFGAFTIQATGPFAFDVTNDLASGNAYWFDYSDLGFNKQLTDTDGRQKWMNINANPNQSGTAAFDLIYGNAVLTGLGTGATGDGNNLLNLAVSGVSKNRVDVYGHMHGGEKASLADTAVLTTNIADTWVGQITVTTSDGYCAIYRIDGAALTTISANVIFSNTKGLDIHWNVYIESNVVKIENQIGTTQTAKALFIGY